MNVAAMPKTASFQMRINPEVKQRAEEIFARCGLTLTDAVNIFLQQSLNTGGLPFLVTQNSQQALQRTSGYPADGRTQAWGRFGTQRRRLGQRG